MASTGSYPDPDSAQMGSGSAGLYVNQNGGGMSPQQQQQQSQPPPQQQPQHVPTDPDLQLQENLSQHLQRNAEMNAQAHQMNQQLNAHHQLHTPPRPAHSPQQMAQSVMSLGEHNPYGDHDLGGPTRKRSKVSRACDECRRKKACYAPILGERMVLIRYRSAAMPLVRMARRHARAANERVRGASLVDSL